MALCWITEEKTGKKIAPRAAGWSGFAIGSARSHPGRRFVIGPRSASWPVMVWLARLGIHVPRLIAATRAQSGLKLPNLVILLTSSVLCAFGHIVKRNAALAACQTLRATRHARSAPPARPVHRLGMTEPSKPPPKTPQSLNIGKTKNRLKKPVKSPMFYRYTHPQQGIFYPRNRYRQFRNRLGLPCETVFLSFTQILYAVLPENQRLMPTISPHLRAFYAFCLNFLG